MAKKNKKKIIVRYAPSPTGLLHLGTVRTCLYNYLFAKKNKGKIIFRLEDTDRERSRDEYTENIINGLKRLGLEADEEPIKQSERIDIHKKHLQDLLDKGLAYYCYCTKEEIEKCRKDCEEKKIPYRYSKKCCELSPEEAKEMQKKNPNPVIRLAIPSEIKEVVFNDLIRSEIRVVASEIDDCIIAKSLEEPLYNFSAVIDDHLMEVTHIIRGEDHISNTPRQILLYQAFDWNVPAFAHLPLILNEDKTKLSKRKNRVSVDDYLNEGYLPEALLNFLALIGWAPGDDREIFTLDELVEVFDLSRVHKGGAIFNLEKLDWLNNQHIKMLLPEDLAERIKQYLQQAKIDFAGFNNDYLLKAVRTIQERLFKLSQAPEQLRFYFEEPGLDKDLLYNEKMEVNESLLTDIWPKIEEFVGNMDNAQFNEDDLKNNFTEFIKDLGLKNGQVLWPIRVALSGLEKSPGVFELMSVLGKEEALKRLNKAK